MLSFAPNDPANALALQYGFVGEKKMIPAAGDEPAKPYQDETSRKWVDDSALLDDSLRQKLIAEGTAFQRVIYEISLSALKAWLDQDTATATAASGRADDSATAPHPVNP